MEIIKNIFVTVVVLFGPIASASISSLNFVDCFEKAVNENIQEIKNTGSKSEKKGICHQLSNESRDEYVRKFTEVRQGKVLEYDSLEMGRTKLITLYDYMKNDLYCYSERAESVALINAITGAVSYNRDLNIVESAFNKMISAEMWDSFFSPNAYKTLNEFDLSYCEI